MRAALLALALVLAAFAVGCAPIETDDERDPAQIACEKRGGDYFCKQVDDCTCIIP